MELDTHMTHPCSLFAARTIATLRAEEFTRSAECNAHIVPEIYFSWKAEAGEVRVDVSSDPETALKVQARVAEPSDWFTLNFPLGGGAFEPGDVIGIVYETRGNRDLDCSALIRSQQDDDQMDTDLEEGLICGPDRQVRTLMHTVSDADGLPYADQFHTLIIKLPQQDFDLDLFDFSLFVLPAARGVQSRGPTLANVMV
jgi:hypothetical protein